MHWQQTEIALTQKKRGFHLITDEILNNFSTISTISIGFLHVFIKHTSASLTINENADPDVRIDMETAVNSICPENMPFVHTSEGADDMPAHVKSSLMGTSVTVPISNGRLNLGTWQGIYLCEHRNRGGIRKIVVTAFGQQ